MSDILTWHGSQKWQGNPTVRESRKGQYEYGPGIYTTTNLNTASKYAKGGGRIIQFRLDPDIVWLEDAEAPLDEVLSFVKNSRLSKKRVLHEDIIACYDRRDRDHFQGMLPLNFLVNLAVNNECLGGKGAPEMAEYLASLGVHASLNAKTSNEDWVVIFDPKIIRAVDVKSAKDIDWSIATPRIKEQLEEIANSRPRSGP